MTEPELEKLARLLADARAGNKLLDAGLFLTLQNARYPVELAYQLQQLACELYTAPQSGYKIGATSPQVQEMLGCEAPFYGPLFERETYTEGAELKRQPGFIGAEAEFAFRLSRDFPHDPVLDTDALPGLIASCHVAVEIVGNRTDAVGLPPLPLAIADFGANSAFIPGQPIDNWIDIDLSNIEVIALADGRECNRGNSSAVMGNPLEALLWLHAALLEQGDNLRAGQWVSTGTCLGVIALDKSNVEINFTGCGSIGYHFQ